MDPYASPLHLTGDLRCLSKRPLVVHQKSTAMTRNYQVNCSTLGWDGQDRSSSLKLGDDPVLFD